ncbi:Hypothetical protein KVN_LOCUS413 [uncultured virus]|nr:Hypothetical protein KVN_LOCUS413 [uncultured virus]
MDKINIGNLFNNYKNDKHTSIDTNNIFDREKRSEDNIKNNFSVQKIIQSKHERKNKLTKNYKKIYNICLKRIDLANKLNITEIIYDVPQIIYGCEEYSTIDCLKYIEKNLQDIKFDTLLLNKKSIFISWFNLEENINNK